MRLRRCAAICVVGVVAGCGGGAVSSGLRAAPSTYLLTVDQLVAPDFSLDTAPHTLTLADVAAGDSARSARLTAGGFTTAAAEDFFRPVGNIDVANGPVQIRDTVEEFATASGASTVYADDVARLDALPGAMAVSTGALGDSAHATTRLVTAPASGVRLIEIVVEWRVENLVNMVLVRGRFGGTRPDDALVLAHAQTVAELGLATPTPRPTPSA
jgi:hypothetical protein